MALILYHQLKLLSDINISKKVGKVSKKLDALDVRRIPTPLRTSKRFLRRYGVSTHRTPHVKGNPKAISNGGMAGNLISAVDKDPSLLGRIVTGEERWCFFYISQSKRASAAWKSPQNLHAQVDIPRRSLKKNHATAVHRYPEHFGIYPWRSNCEQKSLCRYSASFA
ncbi:hypothetical protein TNCV_1721881 [Trichonephila clavipes]|nr:hypothetical protein TNCV_1721881 [Trichonephila clavipes]